ncbi:MAG: hypothetical protein KC550_03230 [Nanoarchaeota archaeon]|nr:hypothetical protein [Nanoarchaeota archaeon]
MKLSLGSKEKENDVHQSINTLSESIGNISEKIDNLNSKFENNLELNKKVDSIYEGLKIVNDKINYMGNLINFQHNQTLGTFATFEKKYGFSFKKNISESVDLKTYFKKNEEVLDLLRASLLVMGDVLDSVNDSKKKSILDSVDEENENLNKKIKLNSDNFNLKKRENNSNENSVENKKRFHIKENLKSIKRPEFD